MYFLQVKLSVFWSYIKSTTGCLFISFLLFLLFAECWSTAARIWLAHWTSSSTSANSTTEHTRDLGIYGGLGFSQAVFILIACFVQAFGSVMASRKLHHELLINILHSPMTFFETTPLGRIVNRFSKDIDIIDDLVPRTFVGFLRSSLELLAAICTISFAMPLFLTVILPLGIFYFFVQVRGFSSPRGPPLTWSSRTSGQVGFFFLPREECSFLCLLANHI